MRCLDPVVRRSRMRPWVLGLCLTLGVSAQVAPKQGIPAAYERTAVAVRLKFIEGILSHRGKRFVLTNSMGLQMDAASERRQLVEILDSATRAGLQTKILEITPQGSRFNCLVAQQLSAEVYNQRKHRLEVTTYKWLRRDLWYSDRGEWKLQASRILSEAVGPSAPFPEAYLRSTKKF